MFAAALLDPGAAHAAKPVHESWAEFMSKATAYLSSRQAAAKREFALESWERYDLDPKTGSFAFLTKAKPGVVARAVIVGSIIEQPKLVPTGMNMRGRHPDGMIVEYVEHNGGKAEDERLK